MKARARLEQMFAQSKLEELRSLNSGRAAQLGVLDLALSAQAFSGNLERALWHFAYIDKHRVPLKPEQNAAVHFALGVAYTRVSQYAEARRHFSRTAGFRHGSDRSKFFLWQSVGFYSFFTGEFEKSARAAARALQLANSCGFAFGELLAEELLAHGLIESGQIRVGMRHLRHALKRARELDNRSLQQSFRLILLLNEARFGLDWQCLTRLHSALSDLHPDETYSRNAVKLELANQLCLRGGLREAFQVLDEACDSIYASQNRRQIAQLNLRLAYMTALRGRTEEASHLLRAAELQLHRDVDASLWLKMQGVRERFGLPLGDLRPEAPKRGMHARILRRQQRDFRGLPFGEDRLGDLYDRVCQHDERVLPELLEHGLLYFLYPYFDLHTDQRGLVFDLLPRGLLILDHGNIGVVTQGFSNVLRRILELLYVSHQSKADLVAKVWGYKYDPERHDPLVYTSISKIRHLLGHAGAWIEMDGKGYRLHSGVSLKSQASIVPGEAVSVARPRLRRAVNLALNFRQLSLLMSFDTKDLESCSVDDLIARYQISRATATRDLTELRDLGFLNRLGRARATRYVRGEKSATGSES